jgi:hypothetical protein
MKMEKLEEFESSNIADAGYAVEQKILELSFKGGGTYWYFEFTRADWELFKNAESKGFKYIKVGEPDVVFDAVLLANQRNVGTGHYLRFSELCELMGWDFLEAWDKALYRSWWLENQDKYYLESVRNLSGLLSKEPVNTWPEFISMLPVEDLEEA